MSAPLRRKLRVGIIGLGRVAWLLEDDPLREKPCTHLGAWLSHPNVRIVAGCDINPERRAQFKQRWPRVAVHEDYREMLARDDLDLVSICAYATERCDMVVAAAKAGVRGIWCEKAMATSLREVERMARTLKRNGTALIMSYVRRYHPLFAKVRSLLDDHAIGTLQTMNVHFSGCFFHTGTHAFDLLRWYGGQPITVQAWLTDAPVPSVAAGGSDVVTLDADWGGDMAMTFPGDVKAFVHGRSRRYFRFELELLGDAGMIRVGNTQAELWRRASSHLVSGMQELDRQPFPTIAPGNMWQAASADLISAVVRGEAVACGWKDGRDAMAIALAAHASHGAKGNAVHLRDTPLDLCVPSR